MRTEKILEGILNNLAEQSFNAKSHEERKKKDKTAYTLIRELYGDDVNKIKHWDDYYLCAKRCLI